MSELALDQAFMPQTDDELWLYVLARTGMAIPRHAVCEGHQAPFAAFADAYFARSVVSIWKGCIPGDAQVTTENGMVRLEDVEIGSRVLGWKGGALGYGTVSDKWISGVDPVLRLRTRVGSLRATGNHRVLVANKYKGKPDGTRRRPPNEWREEWKHARDIVKGDILVQPFGYETSEREGDPALAEWLGLICGDGHVLARHKVGITHHPDAGYMNHYRDFVTERYGKTMHYDEKTMTSYVYKSTAAIDAETFVGSTAHTKRVPDSIWNSTRTEALAFLRGYGDADGTVRTKDGSIEWYSCSTQLLEDVRALCLKHGLRVGAVGTNKMSGTCVVRGRTVTRGDIHTLRCYDGDVIGTNDAKYDFGTRTKRTRSLDRNWDMPQDTDDRRYIKVLDVEDLGEDTVWDLTVEDTDTFVADTFIVHNSRGLGGKSRTLAALAWVEAMSLGAEAELLGGSKFQSDNILTAIREMLDHRGGEAKETIDADGVHKITLHNGSYLNTLTASMTSVRSRHPQRLRMDEVDEMDWEIAEHARGMPAMKPNKAGVIIKDQTVMSSTHQYADKTMSKLLVMAKEKGWPVFEWCIFETSAPADLCLLDDFPHPPCGWLTAERIQRKKDTVSTHTWNNEYLMQTPSIEGRAIDSDLVEAAFDKALGETETDKFVLEQPMAGRTYITAADWAKKKDKTVVATFDATSYPWRCVAFNAFNRLPWKTMVRMAADQWRDYGGKFTHDATGVGDVLDEELKDELSKSELAMVEAIILTGGRKKHDLYNNYIKAIEDGSIEYPRIKLAYEEHLFVTWDDLFGNGHTPDTFVAGMLAWDQRHVEKKSTGPLSLGNPGHRAQSPWVLG